MKTCDRQCFRAVVLRNVLRGPFCVGFEGVLIRVSFCIYIRDMLVYCYSALVLTLKTEPSPQCEGNYVVIKKGIFVYF